MPCTRSLKLGYADVDPSNDLNEMENVLSKDETAIEAYFQRWYFKNELNKDYGNLDNKQANIEVKSGNTTRPSENHKSTWR